MSVVIIREEVCVCVSEKQDFNLPGDAFRSKDREITNMSVVPPTSQYVYRYRGTNEQKKIEKKKKKKESAGSDPEMLAWQAVQLQASCPDFIFPPIPPYCYCYISMSKVGDMSRRYLTGNECSLRRVYHLVYY